MKKKLFSICAMATMLFMASCSEEELISNSDNGDEGVVRFSIGLEDGITTRALAKQENISDGKGADQLMYAVFNAKGDALLVEKVTKKDDVTFDPAYTLDLKLAKNQTYNVVFWAQNSECKAYTVSHDMNVSVNYTDVLNNDETRDAFFKAYNFTVTGNSQTEEVVLNRPFAQLNVGVTKEDWENAVKSGIKITNSTVKVDNVATRLNLLTGEVSDEETVEFALNTIPADLTLSADDETEKELIVKNEEGEDVAYKWLSMTYLLVNDGTSTGAEKAILNDVAFTFKPEAGNNIDLKDGLKGVVPVQRNWRTNIIGQILTGNVTFKITIDQDYDGEYNEEVTSNTVKVTPENISTISFDADNTTYVFEGNFTSEVEVNAAAGKVQIFDATNATFTDHIKFTANRIADGYSYLSEERSGNYKVVGFKTNNSISIGACSVGSLTISNCEAYMMDFNTSNTAVTLSNNKIERPTSAADSYKRYDGGNNDNTIFFYSDNYDLTILNNTINDQKGTGNLLQLLGNYEQYQQNKDIFWTISISISGNTLTSKGDHPMVKIYNDPTYAPVEWPEDYRVTEAAKTLANQLVNENTLSYKKSPMEVLCRATGKADANIALYGNNLICNGSTYQVSDVTGLKSVASLVNNNGKTFKGETIQLLADIDLTGIDWEPIGQTGATEFKRVFDGLNHTIKNLNIDSEKETGANYSSGLFGWIESHKEGITIKNLKVEGANIKGHHNVAVIAGYLEGDSRVENCHVSNAQLSCTSVNNEANGDKCGVIAGYAAAEVRVVDCSATDCTISAGRDAGQIIGAAKEVVSENNKATNVTVTANGTSTGNNISNDIIGRKL